MKTLYIFLLVTFISVNANSQIRKQELKKGDWYVRISPHFWLINLKRQINRPPTAPVPVNPIEAEPKKDIDINFGELQGSIRFAFMGSGQYVQNKVIVRFNLTSLILAGDVITPFDLLLQDIHLRFGYLSGDVGVGYDLIDKPTFNLYAIGGLKYVHFKVEGETNILGKIKLDGARSNWYLDPVIGFYVDYRPFKWLEINGYADLGIFFTNQTTSQSFAEINFFITHWFYLAAGYRYWFAQVVKDEAIYNGSIYGSVVKIGFQIH